MLTANDFEEPILKEYYGKEYYAFQNKSTTKEILISKEYVDNLKDRMTLEEIFEAKLDTENARNYYSGYCGY